MNESVGSLNDYVSVSVIMWRIDDMVVVGDMKPAKT
jgi:hypothetical protein